MAFDPNNPPSLIASGIGGTQGLKHFGWKGQMTITEVLGAGYVRTARKLGMRAGDAVRYVDADAKPHYLVVDAIDPDTGWGTLAFPPTDAAAFPIDENPDGEVYLVTYVDGEQRRVAPEDLTLLSGAGLVVNQKHYTVGTPDGEYVYDGSTTVFPIPHVEGQIMVYDDSGALLVPDVDYTDNGSTTITLASPATAADVISLYALSAATSATIEVGTVTDGATATVTNSGTPSAAVFDFEIPRGDDATVAVGTVTAGAPGTGVTINNVGTPGAAIFDFTIAVGADGMGDVDSVNSILPVGGNVTLAKGDIGLGNVDNTSDANKPVSTAQQTAIDTAVAAALSAALSTAFYLGTA